VNTQFVSLSYSDITHMCPYTSIKVTVFFRWDYL